MNHITQVPGDYEHLDITRCGWVPPDDKLYCYYHDTEWGRPIRESKALFSKLIQDGQQAGLSWIGQELVTTLQDYARDELGLKELFLLSNTKNAAALRLYKRNGWVVNHEGKHPIYDRCNIGTVSYTHLTLPTKA